MGVRGERCLMRGDRNLVKKKKKMLIDAEMKGHICLDSGEKL